MRTKLRSKISLLFLTCAVLLAIPAVALADVVVNNLDNTVDTTLEEMNLTAGGTNGTAKLYVLAASGQDFPQDSQNGCNLAGNNTDLVLNVASDNTTVADVTSQVTISSCDLANGASISVTPKAAGTANISVTQDASTTATGSFTLTPASFKVNVATPPDTTPPQVESINRSTATPTNTAGNLSWVATFSENVTGVDSADFALANTGLGGSPAITNVTGSGTSYTVTASTGTGSGTLGLNLNDNDSIKDAANNTLVGTSTANGSFTGQVYTIDRTKPVISGTATTQPGGANYTAGTWTNQSVQVSFSCLDSGGSDINTNTVAGATRTASGADQSVTNTGTCTDNAGNTADSATFSNIDIDKDAPTISSSADRMDGTTVLGTYSQGTWTNKSVRVSFSCNDPLSGINTTSSSIAGATLTTEGENQSVSSTGSCVDQAGNTTSDASFTNIDIDKVAPSVALVGGPANNSSHYFGSVPSAPTCSASDALSGLNGACSVSGYGTTVGTHTVTATANDMAGNTNSASSTYTVLGWTLKGFYSPVDYDITTPTGVTTVWNTVKGGSTVPLKFEVFAGSTELTDPLVVDKFTATPVKCPNGTLTTDEIEILSTGGTSLRYDGTGGQFIQNWQTPKKPGACYDVTMTTDDGTSLPVAHFQLK
jgi:hypothetical protein